MEPETMELVTEKYLNDEYRTENEQNNQGGYPSDVPTDGEVHPSVYVHERCGGATQMPDSVKYKYLADPCYYFNFLGAVCANCEGPVPHEQLFWTETGECLAEYFKRLIKSKSRAYHAVRYLLPLSAGLFISTVGALGMIADGDPVKPSGFIGGTLIFSAIAWFPCRFIRLILCLFKVL